MASTTTTLNSGARSSGGNPTAADSYVGSLISLTSKSEIRYEGILYDINTDESSIGLRNVRSFGTEGRKKDGPQLPPGEKVYEYILFRGSDIKDLQVKSSTPAQPSSTVNNDPAIIQSHYPHSVNASPSLPSAVPSAVPGTVPDLGSHGGQTGAPGSNFQGGQTGIPGSNFQGGQIGAPGSNFQSGQTGGPVSNFQVGQAGAPGSNFQTGQTGVPGSNFQSGPTGAPGSNFQSGPTGAPGSNFPGGQTGVPGSNFPGGQAGSNFQGGLPLYQPGGNWGASPNGVPMPMYWQGYYGPPPNLQQQSFLRPPSGLPMPPSQMQFPNFNAAGPPPNLQTMNMPTPNLPTPNLLGSNLPTPNLPGSNLPTSNSPSLNLPGSNLPTSNFPSSNLPTPNFNLPTSNFPGSNFPTPNFNLPTLNFPTLNLPTLPEYPTPMLPPNSSSLNTTSTSLPPVTFQPTAPPVNFMTASETLLSSLSTKSTLPSISPLPSSTAEASPVVPPIASRPNAASSFSILGNPNSGLKPVVGNSSSVSKETQTASLVTPDQLQSGPATVLSSQSAQKDVEVVQVSSEPLSPVATRAQPPLLPLPVPSQSRAAQQPNGTPVHHQRNGAAVHHQRNGTPFHNRHGFRGRDRGRGAGRPRPIAKFTEDFDFEAMNEKFNKDEVWDDLGKNKAKDKDDDGKVSVEDNSQYEDDAEVSKAVYNKDDFFDTLSSNTMNRESQNGRTRFSEQVKIDTETFGDFPRYHRGGRGGRGPAGGYSRGGGYNRGGGPPRGGGYYGRGYGYGGRGRGRGDMPNHRAL